MSIGELTLEMHLAGDWRDVTDHARGEKQEVRIERGAGVENGRRPSTCKFTLDNRDHRYSPRNPTGMYYGSLGRNTPLRGWVGLAVDEFDDRTVAEGWGTGAGGEIWASGASGGTILPTDTSVSGGVGVHSVPVVAGYRRTYTSNRSYGTVEIRCSFTLGFSDVTGAAVEPGNVFVRGSFGSTQYWMARVTVQPDETVRVGLLSHTGNLVAAEVTVPGLTHTGQALRVALVAEGQSLRAKVWEAAGPEPAGWHVAGIDGDMPATGYIGVRTGVASGNTNTKPVVVAYDDFEVRDPRAYTEVSQWPTQSDRAGTDVLTPITGSGLLRRLGQGGRPLRSALYRGIAGQSVGAPVAYWPCEDGRDSTVFASGLPGGAPMSFTGDVTLAAFNGAPSSAAIPTYATGTARGQIRPYTSTGALRQFALISVPDTVPATQPIMQLTTTGTIVRWQVLITTVGGLTVRALSETGSLLVDAPFGFGLLGETGLLRLYLSQDGADIDWEVGFSSILGGGGIGSGTRTGHTLGTALWASVGSGANLGGTAVGHVAVYAEALGFWDLSNFAQAWLGERAVDRMVRLASEEGSSLVVVGDPADSPPMGPQRPAGYLDLVRECVDVDQGILGEARGSLSLAYRSRASLYNQAPAITMTAAQLERPDEFVAVDDDRLVVNEVTATRPDGASYTHLRSDGPLAAADPPDGVGRYDRSVTVNVLSDQQLPDEASWRVHVGTVDEARYPAAEVDLTAYPELREQAMAADIGDRHVTTGPPAHLPPDDISTLIQSYSETWSAQRTALVWTLVPESPYRVAVFDDTVRGRADTSGCELATDVDSTDTALSVTTTDGPLWTVDADDWPFDVAIGGELVTVTAVSGTSNPQTMTVTRSVNGVVKSHSAGTDLRLAQPAILS